MDRTSQPDGFRSEFLLTIAVVLICLLAIQGGAVAFGYSPLLRGELIDTDSYMRLVRVERLYASGEWFDPREPRSNAPFGHAMHWTRPFDLLVLAGALPLRPFLEARAAIFWAGALVPPVLEFLTALTLTWSAAPLIRREIRPLVGIGLLAQTGVVGYTVVGHVDHHPLQFLCLAFSLGFVIRAATGSGGRWLPVVAGTVAGLGLWTSSEFVAALFALAVSLWLVWLWRGAAIVRANRDFSIGLASATLAALLLERPPSDWLAVELDRLSLPHLAIAAAMLVFWLGAGLAEMGTAAGRRWLYSLVAGGVCGGALLVAFPGLLAGPLATVNPEIVPLWHDRVGEMQSALPTDVASLKRFVTFAVPIALALPIMAWRAVRERRERSGLAWSVLALIVLLYFGLTLRHVRFAPYGQIVAVIALVWLIGVLRDALSVVPGEVLRSLARATSAALVLIGLPLTAFWTQDDSSAGAAALSSPSCQLKTAARLLKRPDLFGQEPLVIASFIDNGPELLYRTPHAVVSSPYHRNDAGILDAFRLFAATNEDEAREIVETRGIDVLMLCPSAQERQFYSLDGRPETLYQRLRAGEPPAWLGPVKVPPDSTGGYRIFEVKR